VEIEDGFPKLLLDQFFTKRALTNLITNAVQAMPKGGQLSLKVNKNEQWALIIVEDTGIGISKENLARLFQPFFTTKARGQGLGLSVCSKLIEAQGGTISVDSKEGIGTTFTIRMPLSKAAPKLPEQNLDLLLQESIRE